MKKAIYLFILITCSIVGLAQPANNTCTGAQTLTPNGSCVNGTTVGATDTWQGTVGCQDGNNGSNHRDVWYRFVATGTQAQIVVTTGGGFTGNVELIIVQGSCASTFTLVSSQCGLSPLNATVNGLIIGNTYYYTISNASNGNPGTFQTCLTNSTPPPLSGQDCPTAAIICDNAGFQQTSSSPGAGAIFGNNSSENLSALGCLLLDERQSLWYKFTVGCTGTIQFLIDPVDNTNDYDWAIYDITNSGCTLTPGGSAVGGATEVACNFSGCPGNTGIVAGAAAACSYTDFTDCGMGNPNTCDAGDYTQFLITPPTLLAGHTYAMVIDNFSQSVPGFNFTWLGGTAVIGPSADFTYTTPSCGNFNFTKTCPTTNSTYLWTFGDGGTSTDENPSYNYATGGTYTVVLEVTDALGCKKTSSQTVYAQIPVISHSPATNPFTPLKVCSGATVNFTLSSNVPGTSFRWTAGNLGATGTTSGSGGNTITDVVSYGGATSGFTGYDVYGKANGCEGRQIIFIQVFANGTPTFNAIGPFCQNTVAPALPATSTNGYAGTWSPASISTTTVGTTNYTFTPNAGVCATVKTVAITITSPNITPAFNAITPICSGSPAPTLPTTSTNGIVGTWSPATVSNTATATYTFTPNAGQCATTTTLTVTVNASTTPTFNAIAPICSGSPAPILPTTSTNGIVGTWSPATVSNTATSTYTFTPNVGQCAGTTTLTVTVTPSTTPTFNAVAPICSGSAAPTLPTTSNNGITGTWSPATVSNTVTTTYTFTPNAGQCAGTTTLTVNVNPSTTPTFTALAPICNGSIAPTLPTTSNNGISGTWSPATVSNIATTTYTFTPNAGQCAGTTTLTVTVTPSTTPTFNAVAPICNGSAAPTLPTTSTNGITGTWSPATVSNTATTTYTFTPNAGQCAGTTALTVTVTPSTTPTFNAVAPICSGSAAPTLPTTSTNGITGTWSPATVSNTATTTYTFTPNVGQCAGTTTLTVTVTPSTTPSFTAIAPICSGSVAPTLPTTSNNGITGTWSPATVSNTASGTYTFTPNVGQCAGTTTLTVTVTPSTTPSFTAIAPICSGSAAPTLPNTSLNGITGTWSPATVSNTATTTYTFTPNVGQCATTTTLIVTVNASTTPTFNAITPICSGSPAPILPTTSNNGITGNWSPATVSNTATTTYTFTPNAGQCASTTTLTVTVNPSTTPTFTAVAPICSGSFAPTLPTTSNNGITGTWSPATVSNTATTTYTFTPNVGQCAGTTTISVVVNPVVTPTFNAIGSLCQNATAPILPATSLNGISGTWSPATISTTTVGTSTYTFTPGPNQCATSTTVDVTIANQISPVFTQIGPLCLNATAPILPAASNNGITGSWSPVTINTSSAGTTTYTFTPAAGQCATATTTMDIVVTNAVTPTFNPIGSLCQNATAPALPATSLNGITGTWSPATISTATVGTTTYNFTPTAGQCASATTLDVMIANQISPVFTQIGPLCLNATAPTLPATSNNGITGTWNPASINTSSTGTTTYTFTTAAGQCATATTTMDIVVTNAVTPTFNPIGSLCQNATAPILPATSLNGISGTWSPATISTATVGTSTYTFTPTAGQCAIATSLDVTIANQISPVFTQIGPLCLNATAPILPASSNNGITGTWNPASINTSSAGTTTYTFTPAAGQCATATTTMDVVVTNAVVPTFNTIGSFCQNATAPTLPAISLNGITGTWSPAIISTANVGTSTYTFTPTAGQCAIATTLDVTIANQISPVFTQIGPLCLNATAPILPAASNNGITGSWSPVTINTSSAGTTTYTFTPAAGQCATATTTMDIVVTNAVTPTFNPIGSLCRNTTAPILSTTSLNGITGTWSPATISTATVGTTTYNFTPTAGQCASATTLDVTIANQISPVFTQIGPLCLNATAPSLPASSNNGITGTWNPAAISTATAGTTTYTFTPAAGQCATATTTMDIVVTNAVTPTFNPIGSLCQNATAPTLPATSLNGISGTWSPATISTATVGTSTYTFTPTAGQCAIATSLDVTIANQISPVFTQIGPLCLNATAPILPVSSNNGMTGTWNPASINTSSAGTTTYTFTPAAGQCATATTTMDIVVMNAVTPTFNPIGSLCQNATAPTLPATSLNGITGTWSPATISTTTVGTSTYTFTPGPNQCATSTTVDVTIANQISPVFTAIGPLCLNATAPSLSVSSNNGITGTWNPTSINTSSTGTTTYTFTPAAGQCATATTTMDIVVTNNVTPTFNPIGSLCQNATAPILSTTSLNGITGTWSPATISTTTIGTSTYTFTPTTGQCAIATSLDVTIANQISPVFAQIGPLCLNATAPTLPASSNNGITGTWNPSSINTSSAGTTTYTFTPAAGQCAITTTTMDVVVTNAVVPTFNAIGSLCQNATAPTLPATSLNGITGTWSPATISTATVGTSTYTFTPTAGQCAIATSLDVKIANQISPVFTQIGPLCLNATAPSLPVSSNNGITGTWNPTSINTSSTGTTTYTFTPAAGQCATATTTMDIVVTNAVTPTFNPIGSLCQNATAPTLPAISLNGITGTWSPAIISTANVGTSTYTFTPTAGQCAIATTLDVTIANQISPVFTQIGPLCLNATAPILPASSNNGITGTWSPATINTSSTGTTTYTFTPAAGQCATATTTMDIVVTNAVTPTFNPIGSLCQNATAPILSTTSLNGITGTWSPATISTTTVGTSTYTFTPGPNQCATSTTVDVTIANQISPVFTAIGPLCLNATAPSLPVSSNNGITGTWSPASINTSSTGTTTYTFTPAAGQCATATTTMDIVVTNAATPTFNAIGSLCQNATASTLPATSLNGITGTWSPATISTTTVGTSTYTFTPTAGQCAIATTLDVTIANQTSPVFTQIGPLCLNATAPILPASSNNGITGTWSPATINTGSTGTTTYTFTPAAGQCATATTTMDIVVTNAVTPTFNAIGSLCQNATAPILPAISLNGITGTWSPATISTANVGTTTYTFTPGPNQCAGNSTVSVTVTPAIIPVFNPIAALCAGSIAPLLPTTSSNGIAGSWLPSIVDNSITGSYRFVPNPGQCASITNLTITIIPKQIPVFSAVKPVCKGETAPLLPTISNNGISGSWSPAIVSNTISGTYTFTPATGICANSISIDIQVVSDILPVFATIDPVCLGDTAPKLPVISLNNITGTWSPAIVSNTASSTYIFTPDNGQCAIPANLQISVVKKPVANAGPDDFAEYNYPYTLMGSGGDKYVWSPASELNDPTLAKPIATLLTDTRFILEVENEFGCKDYDTVQIKVLNGPEIYVPSAFTPNGDGLNDVFRPLPVGITNIEYFRIFNRYGETVFETNELKKGWDGTYRGIPQNANTYIWQVKGVDRNGKVKILKGTVMLIR